jgi:hypothetical protein
MIKNSDLETNLIEKRTIQVYFEFIRIGEIDTMNEKYNAEICIESKWIEKDLIQNYNPDQHWNPQLFIENTIQEPKEKIKYNIIREGKYF